MIYSSIYLPTYLPADLSTYPFHFAPATVAIFCVSTVALFTMQKLYCIKHAIRLAALKYGEHFPSCENLTKLEALYGKFVTEAEAEGGVKKRGQKGKRKSAGERSGDKSGSGNGGGSGEMGLPSDDEDTYSTRGDTTFGESTKEDTITLTG